MNVAAFTVGPPNTSVGPVTLVNVPAPGVVPPIGPGAVSALAIRATATSPVSCSAGMLVQLLKTPLEGVPSAGVVSVGLVSVLFVSVCDPVSVTMLLGNVAFVRTIALGVPASPPLTRTFAPATVADVVTAIDVGFNSPPAPHLTSKPSPAVAVADVIALVDDSASPAMVSKAPCRSV